MGLLHRHGKTLVREALGFAGTIPVLRTILIKLHYLRHRHTSWMRTHPFDVHYNITTSGMLPPWLLRAGLSADAHNTAYGGCQPSCLRRALSVLPQPLEDFTFIDFGCGKGRAIILASELPFKKIIGIELAPHLVTIAHRNADIVRGQYPQRTQIEIIQGDATAVRLPAEGSLVIFLYHSFGPELVTRMLNGIAEAVTGQREAYLIYENPVNGALVDADPRFTRWFGENVPCAPTEIGYAPDESETVIIWRMGETSPTPLSGQTVPIVVTRPGLKAELLTSN